MKRAIKFRGKRIDNGEWVEGGFGILGKDTDLEKSVITVSTLDTNSYVDRFYFTHFEVIPETVGQFTGLKDKNGVNIFEGDILYYRYDDEMEADGYGEVYNEVVFKDGAFGIMGEITNEFLPFSCNPITTEVVAGNIHDYPEMLELWK